MKGLKIARKAPNKRRVHYWKGHSGRHTPKGRHTTGGRHTPNGGHWSSGGGGGTTSVIFATKASAIVEKNSGPSETPAGVAWKLPAVVGKSPEAVYPVT